MLLTLDDSHPRTGNADTERRLLFFSVESDTARSARMTSLKSSPSGTGAARLANADRGADAGSTEMLGTSCRGVS